jgi:hypothetical protein
MKSHENPIRKEAFVEAAFRGGPLFFYPTEQSGISVRRFPITRQEGV